MKRVLISVLMFSFFSSSSMIFAHVDETGESSAPTQDSDDLNDPDSLSDEELRDIAKFLAGELVLRLGNAYDQIKHKPLSTLMMVYKMLVEEGEKLSKKFGSSLNDMKVKLAEMIHAMTTVPYGQKAREGFVFIKYFMTSLLEAVKEREQGQDGSEGEALLAS